MNMTSSIFNSTNNYSYLMGSSDQDLLDNQAHHILRNIDNSIMDYRSNDIKLLDENLNKIKENIKNNAKIIDFEGSNKKSILSKNLSYISLENE